MLTRRHWLVFAVCAIGAFLDSLDLQMMSLISPVLVRQWALAPRTVGVIASAAMVGMLCGSLVFGRVSDRIGRRPAFQLTVTIFAGFSALCAVAHGPTQLIVLRFCVGVGIGGFIPVDTAMLYEFLPRLARARMLGLWAIAFPLGGLAATFLIRGLLPTIGWRGVFLMGAGAALIVLPVRRSIPESPKFLMSQGRVTEANASAQWISGSRAVPDPFAPAPKPMRELLSGRYLRTTLVAWSLWFTWSFSYFGITLWLPTLLVLAGMPLDKMLLYTVGFQIAAIAGRAVMLPMVGGAGPRAVIVLMAAGSAFTALWFGALPGVVFLVAVGYVLSCCQEGGFTGIVPFTPQLYPIPLRATGVGTANGAGRVGSLLAPLLVGWLTESGNIYLVFVIFAASYGLSALAAFFLKPPNLDTPLPDEAGMPVVGEA